MKFLVPMTSVVFLSLSMVFIFSGCSAHRPKPASPPAWAPYQSLPTEERIADAGRRRGDYYANRLKLFMEEMDEIQPGGTVFLGDSITEQFPLRQAFAGQNVINRGIGGDKINGLRERLDVCVTRLEPKTIYVMIGTNDVFAGIYNSDEVLAEDYRSLLREIQYCAPVADMTVFSVLPAGLDFIDKNPRVHQFNAILEPIVKAEGLKYIDLHPHLGDKKGELKKSYTTEGIHLTLDGYYAWLGAFLAPEEYYQTAVNLASLWKEKHSSFYQATKINPQPPSDFPGGRGADELIVYTPDYGKPSTGTNEWGIEAIVGDDVVNELAKSDSLIPANGMVISGHGKGANWITSNLSPGTQVTLKGNTIILTEPAFESLSNEQALVFLKKKLYSALGSQDKKTHRLFMEIQKLDPQAPGIREQLKEIKKTLDKLSS